MTRAAWCSIMHSLLQRPWFQQWEQNSYDSVQCNRAQLMLTETIQFLHLSAVHKTVGWPYIIGNVLCGRGVCEAMSHVTLQLK